MRVCGWANGWFYVKCGRSILHKTQPLDIEHTIFRLPEAILCTHSKELPADSKRLEKEMAISMRIGDRHKMWMSPPLLPRTATWCSLTRKAAGGDPASSQWCPILPIQTVQSCSSTCYMKISRSIRCQKFALFWKRSINSPQSTLQSVGNCSSPHVSEKHRSTICIIIITPPNHLDARKQKESSPGESNFRIQTARGQKFNFKFEEIEVFLMWLELKNVTTTRAEFSLFVLKLKTFFEQRDSTLKSRKLVFFKLCTEILH